MTSWNSEYILVEKGELVKMLLLDEAGDTEADMSNDNLTGTVTEDRSVYARGILLSGTGIVWFGGSSNVRGSNSSSME